MKSLNLAYPPSPRRLSKKALTPYSQRNVSRPTILASRKSRMKLRRGIGLTHCPSCGARIVPSPKEMREWRMTVGLTQRQMGARVKVSAAYVAYLDNGKRTPSASGIKRYWEVTPA